MFTDKTKIREILADEDFAEFQEFLFPEMFVKNKLMRMLPLKVFDKVWSVESIVSGFQYMKELREKGERLFYRIYDEKEAQKDPSLRQRVLFHFPVEGKRPFVVICAGGGVLLLFNPFDAASTMTLVAGIAILVYGLSELFSTWKMSRAIHEYEIKFPSSSSDSGKKTGGIDYSEAKDADFEKVGKEND